MQRCGDAELDRLTAMAGLRRPRPIGRQVELLGQVRQGALPVGDLPRHVTVGIGLLLHPLALPQAIVGVLHRQRLPRRHLPAGARLVGRGQVADQRRQRSAIAGDVMHQQQQNMVVRAEPVQGRANGQFARKIEAVRGGALLLGEQRAGCNLAQVERQHGGLRCKNDLAAHAVGLLE